MWKEAETSASFILIVNQKGSESMNIIVTDRGLEYFSTLDLKEKAIRVRAIDTFE
jgi:hypothetical protein